LEETGRNEQKKDLGMKTIGLIGGMSWESSLEYYRIINEATQRKLGGLHSSKCFLYSVDFAEIEELQRQNRWDDAAEHMIKAGQSLEKAGADFIVICTNTMHKLAEEIRSHVNIPLLHIADAAAKSIKTAKLKNIGLLGTRYTMEEDFYTRRLVDRHGLNILIPEKADREKLNGIIFNELCLGMIKPASREYYLNVIEKLAQAGAEGIILGCTEIELLVHPEDTPIPLFPTTRLHAMAAVKYAIENESDIVY
jgi:aspartate racemase